MNRRWLSAPFSELLYPQAACSLSTEPKTPTGRATAAPLCPRRRPALPCPRCLRLLCARVEAPPLRLPPLSYLLVHLPSSQAADNVAVSGGDEEWLILSQFCLSVVALLLVLLGGCCFIGHHLGWMGYPDPGDAEEKGKESIDWIKERTIASLPLWSTCAAPFRAARLERISSVAVADARCPRHLRRFFCCLGITGFVAYFTAWSIEVAGLTPASTTVSAPSKAAFWAGHVPRQPGTRARAVLGILPSKKAISHPDARRVELVHWRRWSWVPVAALCLLAFCVSCTLQWTTLPEMAGDKEHGDNKKRWAKILKPEGGCTVAGIAGCLFCVLCTVGIPIGLLFTLRALDVRRNSQPNSTPPDETPGARAKWSSRRGRLPLLRPLFSWLSWIGSETSLASRPLCPLSPSMRSSPHPELAGLGLPRSTCASATAGPAAGAARRAPEPAAESAHGAARRHVDHRVHRLGRRPPLQTAPWTPPLRAAPKKTAPHELEDRPSQRPRACPPVPTPVHQCSLLSTSRTPRVHHTRRRWLPRGSRCSAARAKTAAPSTPSPSSSSS